MKVLHTADWHVRDKDIEEGEKCLAFLVETAMAQKVDLAVIAGDTFDSRDIKLDSLSAKLVVKTISKLADICPVFIVIGTPSHDGLAAEVLNYAMGSYPVHVATKPEQIHRTSPGEFKYLLTLVPQPTKQFFQTNSDIQSGNVEISQAMNALFAGFGAQAEEQDCPHILVGHWNVSGAKLSTGQTLTGQDIDISIDQMMLASPGVICLGHIHMPQQLGDRTFYSGSLYPLTWGETEEKGGWIHEFKAKNLYKSIFIKTPCRKLIRKTNDFTTSDMDLNFAIYSEPADELKDAYVRHDITVWQDESGLINKEEIRNHYLAIGAIDADIRIHRIPRQTVRSETVLKVETLREKLVAMAALKEETVQESILIKADELEVGPTADVIRMAT